MIETEGRRGGTVTRVDLIIYLLLTVFFIYNLASLDYSAAHWAVVFTFFLLGSFFYYRILAARESISLYRIYYIFCFIFLFYAPLQQYLAKTVFQVNNGWMLIYTDAHYLRANAVLLVFTVLFEFAYRVTRTAKASKTHFVWLPTTQLHMTLLFCSCIATGILVVTGNLFASEGYDVSNAKVGVQINNILRFFPVACFLVTKLQDRAAGCRHRWVSAIFLLEVVLVFFPFYGSVSRFLLFGVYLMIISLYFSHAKHRSLYFLLYVVGYFFIFSAFNYFKLHSLTDLSGFALSLTDFKTIDYDAYQMLMATISYVDANGCAFGCNILTALFNFIPRSIWSSKMLPSGQIVAEYYGTWFTNLSCPFVAEGYLAFGLFGVVLAALVAGFVIKKLDGFDSVGGVFRKGLFYLVSGMLIYLLRGAMLPTFSYMYALIVSLSLAFMLMRLLSVCATSTRQEAGLLPSRI